MRVGIWMAGHPLIFMRVVVNEETTLDNNFV